MLAKYVVLDLLRNPRRTASTLIGVSLGVGLFCGVLFFIDGLSASMTQRAIAPLAIDMQRILSQRTGANLALRQTVTEQQTENDARQATVRLELRNLGAISANEVTVRSRPAAPLQYIAESAEIDGVAIAGYRDNPFAHGAGKTGYNLGTVEPGGTRVLTYRVEIDSDASLDGMVRSWYSSRESITPVPANRPPPVALAELAKMIARVDGVGSALPLSFADLGADKLSANGLKTSRVARIFGFDPEYAHRDKTIRMLRGVMDGSGAVLSAEAATALRVEVGDPVTIHLPDQSSFELAVTGIADLSRARALFRSRRGADLESFIYRPVSIIVSSRRFADNVFPAYQLAGSDRGALLKNPPVREVDITLDHKRLNGAPAAALMETRRISETIMGLAAHQDFLLDNISNTLEVAVADADTAKRLFFFLGIPGGLLATMLAVYAASVLATVQRREHATLRIRGASRRHLLKMLALRTVLITGTGSITGLILGLGADFIILDYDSVLRAGTAKLLASALLGALGGFLATGCSLYLTGHLFIERQINEDRARHFEDSPYWKRLGLDIVAVILLLGGTLLALQTHAFEGAAGSVYYGKQVELNLGLLVFPVAVWFAGSLFATRVFIAVLTRIHSGETRRAVRPWPDLFRLSLHRRPWPIGNGAVIISLIVSLAISLGAFTASYNNAKAEDARFANGADIRITPGPAIEDPIGANAGSLFRVDGVSAVTPVIFGIQNVVLRSARTSDPASLIAIDPESFARVAPMHDADFVGIDAAAALDMLKKDPDAVLLSDEMADFLQAEVGDDLQVLLVRGTSAQVEITRRITGLFKRLPGCPDGAQAMMSIQQHEHFVPDKSPDFFLAATSSDDATGLQKSIASLLVGPGSQYDIHIDSRASLLEKDQSSLAALNIAGLIELDSFFSLAMAAVSIGIFVFGLLLQRRREYVTLRAQGVAPATIRMLISAEAGALSVGGCLAGILVGVPMGFYFVRVLQPLFVHPPQYLVPPTALTLPVLLVFAGTTISAIAGSRLINRLQPTELLRDE